jgi:hypothetical protein
MDIFGTAYKSVLLDLDWIVLVSGLGTPQYDYDALGKV